MLLDLPARIKIDDSDAKLPRKLSSRVPEHVVENGIIKEISENKSLNNGVAVKTDPIGLDKLCMSDGESDPVYKASSSKFQALDNEDFSSDSSSGSIQRKKNQKLLQRIQLQDIPKADSPTLAAFSEFISELDVPSSSSIRNNVTVVEAGRPFRPAMFEGVLRNFTPDVLNNMSGRPRQEDAQEFLTVTRTQSFVPSELSEIFGGQLKSVVKAKGTKASATVQPYLLLHLDIHPDGVKGIEDALHLFSAQEDLEGYRASVTGKTGVVSASKSIKIQKLSKIMILHLMRFSYGSQGSTKLHKGVKFPLELNLNRNHLVSLSNESLRYELVATITHHGWDPSKGHYTTDARRKNGQWLRFDDASVTAIGTKQVLHDQAYVLFYKQV
ncbi:unnamed protein product [Arabidopsis arenosa]|uniref:ubiquitinyl hydrolase 1 n=1 Tax=Arabidopsis arenosa TaxID=38785 RepID=A0A8S2AZH0_ARAAE|nr:unnamed protein product [Arabidopsis arenosa]